MQCVIPFFSSGEKKKKKLQGLKASGNVREDDSDVEVLSVASDRSISVQSNERNDSKLPIDTTSASDTEPEAATVESKMYY